MEFDEVIRSRYSVRAFSDRAIEADKLARILEAGRIAPTAVNYQPQRVYILQSEDALKKANALCPCIYGAPTVLLFAYDENADWKNAKQAGIRSGVQDVSIVATHIMLAAWNEGIGSCWVNLFQNSEVEKVFALPANERCVLLMSVGYPAENAEPYAPWHNVNKPLSETVAYL
mgnify:CR=1 FL=1